MLATTLIVGNAPALIRGNLAIKLRPLQRYHLQESDAACSNLVSSRVYIARSIPAG